MELDEVNRIKTREGNIRSLLMRG